MLVPMIDFDFVVAGFLSYIHNSISHSRNRLDIEDFANNVSNNDNFRNWKQMVHFTMVHTHIFLSFIEWKMMIEWFAAWNQKKRKTGKKNLNEMFEDFCMPAMDLF